MEKCPKCHGAVFTEAEIDRNGYNIQYKRCVICGDLDYLNGTHEIKLLRDLNRRIRARRKRMWSYQVD